MLQADDFVDHYPGEHVFMLHHQYPPLFAQRRQFMAEEAAQVHDRQQPPAQVSHTLDPRLDPGQLGEARLMQDFADFAHRRHIPMLAEAKADAAPAIRTRRLRRQVGCQQAAALVDLPEQFERGQRFVHDRAISR